MLGHHDVIDPKLGAKVAEELGMPGEALKASPAANPIALEVSPALRLYGKYKPTLKGRKVGVLLAAGFNLKLKNSLVIAIKKEGATRRRLSLSDGGWSKGCRRHQPSGGNCVGRVHPRYCSTPWWFWRDLMAIKALSGNPDAVGFLTDACRHLKAIGLSGVPGLAAKTRVGGEVGVIDLGSAKDVPGSSWILRATAKYGRREPLNRS